MCSEQCEKGCMLYTERSEPCAVYRVKLAVCSVQREVSSVCVCVCVCVCACVVYRVKEDMCSVQSE